MKRTIFAFSLIAIFILCSCNTTKRIPYERNGMVEYLKSEGSNITLTSRAVAETSGKASYYAEINALENLLYKGIPNSNHKNPLIENENSKTKSLLDNFIDSGDFKLYLISSYVVESRQNNALFNVVQEVTYDMDALRKRLEKEGLIRKFGL